MWSFAVWQNSGAEQANACSALDSLACSVIAYINIEFCRFSAVF